MSKRDYQSLYFADDKDIHDFLGSNRQQITQKILIRFLRELGVLAAPDASREYLCSLVAAMPSSWVEFSRLSCLTELKDRPERTTFEDRELVVSAGDLNAAAQKLARPPLEDDDGDVVHVTRQLNGDVEMRVTYSEMDPTRSRLLQRTRKEVIIKIEHGDDSLRFRYPANAKSEEVVERLLKELSPGANSAAPPRKKLSLAGITSAAKRTRFFIDLTCSIEGFKSKAISTTKVKAIPEGRIDADEADDDESELIESNKATFVASVKDVVLRGQNLTSAAEYQALVSGGFYIAGLSWTAEETDNRGVRVCFEARFKNATRSDDFEYKIPKIFVRDEEGIFKTTGRSLDSLEREKFAKKLEDAAQLVAAKIENDIPDMLSGFGTSPDAELVDE